MARGNVACGVLADTVQLVLPPSPPVLPHHLHCLPHLPFPSFNLHHITPFLSRTLNVTFARAGM